MFTIKSPDNVSCNLLSLGSSMMMITVTLFAGDITTTLASSGTAGARESIRTSRRSASCDA